jgi:hypothetical protein
VLQLQVDKIKNSESVNAIAKRELESKLGFYIRANEKAQKQGRKIQKEDIEPELEALKPIITKERINNALCEGQEYLRKRFLPNSAWDCAILISTLLEIGEASNSDFIKDARNLLLNKKILKDNLVLWGNPDNNIPNIFDISFAVIALKKLGIDEDQKTINDAINFIKSSRDNYGGWQPIPGMDEIDVGATSWAIIALLECGLSKTDDDVAKGIKWLKENQHDEGGWGSHHKRSQDKKSYIGRTYDAIMALLLAKEAENNITSKAKDWLIEQHKLLCTNEKTNTWAWAWEGYNRPGAILENDIENTVLAVITLLKLNLSPDSDPILSGINTILEKKTNAWETNTPRVLLCLREFYNSFDWA